MSSPPEWAWLGLRRLSKVHTPCHSYELKTTSGQLVIITKLNEIAPSAVSHNAAISKKTILSSDQVSHLVYFSTAIFPPGEVANAHLHSDMTEVFFVQSGLGKIVVDEKVLLLEPGTCVTVEPNESHELINSGNSNLEVIYFGIKT